VPIVVKKPTVGALPLGDDHCLECQLTWNTNGEHPDLNSSAFYVAIKHSDVDEEVVIEFNSIDDATPAHFIITNNVEGEMEVKIFHSDQEHILPDIKYAMDMLVILANGERKTFILDRNIVFTKTLIGEI
jgi:hypothetical protein